VREDEIQHAGGDLIATMHRMLLAAGRTEAPFIRAGKGMVELGWRTAGGCEVFAQALSGGEWVLFAAALTASVILLRNAPVRVLLVEAAEADAGTLADILNPRVNLSDPEMLNSSMRGTVMRNTRGAEVRTVVPG